MPIFIAIIITVSWRLTWFCINLYTEEADGPESNFYLLLSLLSHAHWTTIMHKLANLTLFSNTTNKLKPIKGNLLHPRDIWLFKCDVTSLLTRLSSTDKGYVPWKEGQHVWRVATRLRRKEPIKVHITNGKDQSKCTSYRKVPIKVDVILKRSNHSCVRHCGEWMGSRSSSLVHSILVHLM